MSTFYVLGTVLNTYTFIVSFNPYNDSVRMLLLLLLFVFYWWDNWGWERLSNKDLNPGDS